ncbi:hypothetical protein HMPREF1092_01448 [Clostridium thermobutyricum]|uniref:Co-chaperone DjlA N-terminal domain-containing protein n=1 Tax=Clostridium thermobutyricum TaxID=29372 RepID=N9XRC0_9CLOT|nr:hypothetical protein [Clostridium thermobutyricum]ENZ02213.1 hypothetical protein HMPREF1092_01448 [Clostridium thermobutyricum]
MFLKEFNTNEKRAFANLIYMLADVDKVIARNEKKIIKEYLNELEIKEENFSKMTYAEVVYNFKQSSDRIKKIAYFELLGLALVDGNYEEQEIDYLDKVANDLGITRAKKIAFANFFYNFKNIHKVSVIKTEGKEINLEAEAEKLF